MTYTISIADDEPRVRKGLQSLIRARGGGWEVEGLFQDGRSALAAVEAKRVDVILADIRMPGLDGLELAHALRTVSPATVVVVMSGYKEFDYARRAMKAGVMDFIVKPIEEAELFGVLDRARAEIDRRRARDRQAALARDAGAIGEALLAELLAPGAPAETETRLYQILELDPGEIVVLSLLPLPSADASAVRPSLAELRALLADDGPVAARALPSRDTLVVLAAGPASRDSGSGEAVMRRAREIAAGIQQRWQTLVRVGVSRAHAGHGQLRAAVEESSMAMRPGYYERGRGVFFFEPPGSVVAVPFPAAALDRLAACLVTGDREATETSARELLLPYRDAQAPPALLDEHLRAAAARLQEALSPVLPDSEQLASLAASLAPAARHGWFEALESGFLAAMGRLCTEVERANRNRLSRAVRGAIRYIEDNYGRDLPLEEVARSAGLSPSYFSSCFKRETGRTVVEYISDYRVERAIGLLSSTTLNTSEVAYRVGFNDPKYFARIFKKSVGVTPSLYRKYSQEK